MTEAGIIFCQCCLNNKNFIKRKSYRSSMIHFQELICIFVGFYGTCVFDDAKDRVLKEYFFSSKDMTIDMCLSACRSKGFRYSGLQWSIECYCGEEPVNGFEFAWLGKCSHRCAGNSNQICGGSYAMSVYSTPQFHLDGLCIFDYPSPRGVLGGLSITDKKNTTFYQCKDICKGQ